MNSSSSSHYSSRINPLPISDLLNSESRHDVAVLPVFEEPVNYHSHIQKLINRTKNVEADIVKNAKHGDLLFNEFFRLLQTTEMVAFDIMYVDCMFGAIKFKDFYEFIGNCKDVKFSFVNATELDIKQAADHIRYLHSVIQTAAKDLQAYDSRTAIEPPERPHKIYTYLSDLTSAIEAQIKNIVPQRRYEPAEIGYSYQSEVKTVSSISPKLIAHFTDYLKPKSDSNETIAPNRSLFGNLIHRMYIIDNLQNELKSLEKTTILPRYTSALDLDPKNIQKSPFFRAIIGNSVFLRMAINKFLSAQAQIDACEASAEASLKSFSPLLHKCQDTLHDIEEIQKQIRQSISKKQASLKDDQKEFLPLYDLLLSDPKIEKILKYIETVTQIEDEVMQLFEKEQKEAADTEYQTKIGGLMEIMKHELMPTRNDIFALCRKCADERKDNTRTQKMLLNLVADILTPNEKIYIYKREIKELKQYSDELDNVHRLFQKDKIDAWCAAVNEALDEMQRVIEERREIYEEAEKGDKSFRNIKAAKTDNEIIKSENGAVKINNEITKTDYETVETENKTVENENKAIENENNIDNKIIGNESKTTNRENETVEIEEETVEIDNENDDEEEMKRLEMEIEAMERELAEVSDEKLKAQEEVEAKKERLFDQIQMNDIYIIYQGSNLQRTQQLRKYKESITCPVCKDRRCEVIINKNKCNHAFCKQCVKIENETGNCPICGTHYTNDNIESFLFIPSS